ncbi:MAG: molybdenum cofactor guanylyltransferase [Caulobacteraceae bacterium]|nr:molybdenum cofactor guanylyltransferase [Caulobacteraceae bacterium]
MIVAGVVLAGGRSRRFGRDKAREPLAGRPLIAWSLETLVSACARLAVNGPPELAAMFDLPAIADLDKAQPGPLAGLASALAWAASEGCSHCLTVPCDTPFLPAELGQRLIAAAGEAPVVAARALRRHPLCGLWRVELAARLAELAVSPDQAPLQHLVDELGGGWVTFPDEGAFANLNTPGDFAAAAARLESHGSR